MCRLSRIGGSLLSAMLALSTFQAQAEDDWWFDVEVIVFDRNAALTQLQETFEYAKDVSPYSADIDVIGSIIHPDISWIKQNLARCDGSDAPLWQPVMSLQDITQAHAQWLQEQQPASVTTPLLTDDESEGEMQVTQSAVIPSPTDSGVDGSENLTVDATDIAGYWVEFSGINEASPAAVPRFRYCEETLPWLTYSDSGWKRHTPDNRLPAPQAIPIELSGHNWPRASQAHLLSANAQELEKLSEQIRRSRDLTRLLHVTWRQEVKFGQEEASSVRLYAGQNYADRFTLDGYAIAPTREMRAPTDESQQEDAVKTLTEDTFFADLNARLAAPQTVPLSRLLQLQASKDSVITGGVNNKQTTVNPDTPIWQVDGYMKVFLKYINRVPYLHIDSDMFYRQPVPVTSKSSPAAPEQPEYKLVSVPFKQLRRVISNQLHYFDHPLFGMVVEIRRYERPAQQEDADQE